MERAEPSARRCAVYTRKSSEEGLWQDFNSLQAQRETCEAFIKSQAGEGWRLIKTAYDDGGLSGGNMERPALQRLLSDIRAGLIDVVARALGSGFLTEFEVFPQEHCRQLFGLLRSFERSAWQGPSRRSSPGRADLGQIGPGDVSRNSGKVH